MSKSIKIEEDVYQDLDAMRGKRDTFSQVIARLIYAAAFSYRAGEILEGFPPSIRSQVDPGNGQ